MTQKKITKATFKSFIKKNAGKLELNVTSSFDGMTDCCESRNDGFRKAVTTDKMVDNNCGIDGVWLVGGSRDYFTAFETDTHTGIRYSNCCGRGIIATRK